MLEALTLAQQLSQPFNLAWALSFVARLHYLCREEQAVQERAEAEIELCGEQGFPYWLAVGTILRGWALAEQEKEPEGILQMGQGLAAHRATGSNLDRPYYLAMLAEAYGKTGQVVEGLIVLAEALAAVDNMGERFYEAELYRLKGELLLTQESKSQKPVLSFAEGAKGKSQKSENTDPRSLIPDPRSEAEACFYKPLRSLGSNKLSRWNCEQRQALLACGNNKVSNSKHTSCYPRSTIGSPRDLIPRTCKRRRR
jgi:hypothetical protein